jgi:hypothetical protein
VIHGEVRLQNEGFEDSRHPVSSREASKLGEQGGEDGSVEEPLKLALRGYGIPISTGYEAQRIPITVTLAESCLQSTLLQQVRNHRSLRLFLRRLLTASTALDNLVSSWEVEVQG